MNFDKFLTSYLRRLCKGVYDIILLFGWCVGSEAFEQFLQQKVRD